MGGTMKNHENEELRQKALDFTYESGRLVRYEDLMNFLGITRDRLYIQVIKPLVRDGLLFRHAEQGNRSVYCCNHFSRIYDRNMRKCTTCGDVKPLNTKFYYATMKNNRKIYTYSCIECTRAKAIDRHNKKEYVHEKNEDVLNFIQNTKVVHDFIVENKTSEGKIVKFTNGWRPNRDGIHNRNILDILTS